MSKLYGSFKNENQLTIHNARTWICDFATTQEKNIICVVGLGAAQSFTENISIFPNNQFLKLVTFCNRRVYSRRVGVKIDISTKCQQMTRLPNCARL